MAKKKELKTKWAQKLNVEKLKNNILHALI